MFLAYCKIEFHTLPNSLLKAFLISCRCLLLHEVNTAMILSSSVPKPFMAALKVAILSATLKLVFNFTVGVSCTDIIYWYYIIFYICKFRMFVRHHSTYCVISDHLDSFVFLMKFYAFRTLFEYTIEAV